MARGAAHTTVKCNRPAAMATGWLPEEAMRAIALSWFRHIAQTVLRYCAPGVQALQASEAARPSLCTCRYTLCDDTLRALYAGAVREQRAKPLRNGHARGPRRLFSIHSATITENAKITPIKIQNPSGSWLSGMPPTFIPNRPAIRLTGSASTVIIVSV